MILKEDYVYPVILKKVENGVLFSAPDFSKESKLAENEACAIKSAQEMIASYIIKNEDTDVEIPTTKEDNEITIKEGDKLIYVHLWMPYFRKKQKDVYVKKTLTIPDWLNKLATARNINFSAVLVKGLKEELGVTD